MARPQPLPATASDFSPVDLTSVATACAADEKACWEVFDKILHVAESKYAHEIHLEAEPDCLRIRFRSAFEMVERRIIERYEYDKVLALLKRQLWGVDADAHSARGWFYFTVASNRSLFQMDIVKASSGESVLLTQLDESWLPPSKLEEIGLSRIQLATLKRALQARQGLIVIASDVPQARRRTARAITQQLIAPDKKLIVAETPVHPHLPRTTQMAMDFPATQLQTEKWEALCRLGSDAIINTQTLDAESARWLINQAAEQTLVVSSVACGSASAALGKLLSLGVRSETLAHCFSTIVTQHRVRCLCPHCRHSVAPDDEATVWLAKHSPMHAGNVNDWLRARMRSSFGDAQGCEQCNHTGCRSWLDIFDVISVDSELKDTLYDSDYQYAFAQLEHKSTLIETLLKLASEGIISLDEAIRVTR